MVIVIQHFQIIKRPITKNDSIWNYSRFPKGYLRSTYKDYFDGLRNKNKMTIGFLAYIENISYLIDI